MRAAIDRIDVVGEGVDAFGEAVVVLQRHLDRRVADATLHVKRPRVQRHAAQVQVAYERDDAAFEVEGPLALGVLARALIDHRDAEAFGEIGHLSEALRQRVEVEVDAGEDRPIGHEADRRAVGLVGIADPLDWLDRHAFDVLLDVQATILAHLGAQPLAERIHHAGAHAV